MGGAKPKGSSRALVVVSSVDRVWAVRLAARTGHAWRGHGRAAEGEARRHPRRGAARRARGSCVCALSSRLSLKSQKTQLRLNSNSRGLCSLPSARSPLCPISQETRRGRTPVSSPSELRSPRGRALPGSSGSALTPLCRRCGSVLFLMFGLAPFGFSFDIVPHDSKAER